MEKRINVSVIDGCIQCKHAEVDYSKGSIRCPVFNRRIPDADRIPRWCELPKPPK